MTYSELEVKAKRYLATFPDQPLVQIYTNGFLAEYLQRDVEDDSPEVARDVVKEALERYNATCTAFGRIRVLSDSVGPKPGSYWRRWAR